MRTDLVCHFETICESNMKCYGISLHAPDIPAAILDLLRLSYKKKPCVRWQGTNGQVIEWRWTEGVPSLTIEHVCYPLDARRWDLILSFPLDATDPYPAVNHIDLDLTDRIDLTLSCQA